MAQLVGTTTMVTIGYCPLICLLTLAPMNRTDVLTLSLLWRVLVLEPYGSLRWGLPQRANGGS
jgi:hypothetical protein